MLRERGSNIQREVDVLVEANLAGCIVRLAVECRDRTRRDDIEWIDQLVGKSRDLPVDKIIAVSNSGLTPAALEKAAANNIEVRTLVEAFDADWPKELVKSHFANLNIYVKVKGYTVFTDPEWPEPKRPSSATFAGRTLDTAEFEEMLTQVAHQQIARILEEATDHPLRRLENLNRGYEMAFELGLREPTTLTATAGTTHKLLHLTLACQVTFRYEDIPVTRHLFGDIGVTLAVDEKAEPTAVRIMRVQVPGESPAELTVPLDPSEE